MDRYSVKLTSRVLRDPDSIYAYIAGTLLEPGTALSLVGQIEKQICSLEYLPYRCPKRNRGTYANCGYRQLLVGNYTVIYRIDEAKLFRQARGKSECTVGRTIERKRGSCCTS